MFDRQRRRRNAVFGFATLLPALLICSPAQPLESIAKPQTLQSAPSFADLADLFADAPVVARARIRQAIPIKPVAKSEPPRVYVEADVTALVRSPAPLPPVVRYLAQPATDSRGRLPRLTKADVLIAARAARPGELQLVAADAQLPWSAPVEAQVRAIVAASSAADAPPAIKDVSSAFHVAGTVAGESETQIFLDTASGRPASLSILRRPAQEPRWSVAFGDVVDEGAPPPGRDTLAWYRLACFLPQTLPDAATTELQPTDADAARTDYTFVIAQLGPCTRTRAQK